MAPQPRPIVVVDGVYAVIVTSERTDDALVTYWARGVNGYGPPLFFMDFESVQLMPQIFDQAQSRLEELALETRSRHSVLGVWVEGERLTQLVKARGIKAHVILEHLSKPDNWSGLWASAAMFVRDVPPKVAVTPRAAAKFERSAFRAREFRGGPRPDDDLSVPAWLYGIVLGLDETAKRPPPPARVVLSKGQPQR